MDKGDSTKLKTAFALERLMQAAVISEAALPSHTAAMSFTAVEFLAVAEHLRS